MGRLNVHKGNRSAKRQRGMRRRASSVAHAPGRHRGVVPRVLLVLFVLLLMSVPPLFVNNPIGYLGLVAAVAMLAMSFVYLQVLKRSLSFEEDLASPSCERGSQVEFSVTFANSSLLVFTRLEPYLYVSDLFGGYDTVTPVRMMLMPHERSVYRFKARFPHIGTYSAGVQKVVVYDLLGLE